MQSLANVIQNGVINFRYSQENAVLESLFNKATGLMACNFIKKKTQVFSCKYHKMCEKSFFYGTPPVVASENG